MGLFKNTGTLLFAIVLLILIIFRIFGIQHWPFMSFNMYAAPIYGTKNFLFFGYQKNNRVFPITESKYLSPYYGERMSQFLQRNSQNLEKINEMKREISKRFNATKADQFHEIDVYSVDDRMQLFKIGSTTSAQKVYDLK